MVKFEEPVLMGIGLDEKVRKELLNKMIKLRETDQKTKDDDSKDSSALKQKADNKMLKFEREDKVNTSNMVKDFNILKAREGGNHYWKEDLAKNVSLNLHNSFCLNRKSKVQGLPNQAKRLQEQRELMRSYEQLKDWEEIVISSDDEEALLRQIMVSNASGPSTSKERNTIRAGSSVRDSWVLRGKERGSSVNSDEI